MSWQNILCFACSIYYFLYSQNYVKSPKHYTEYVLFEHPIPSHSKYVLLITSNVLSTRCRIVNVRICTNLATRVLARSGTKVE